MQPDRYDPLPGFTELPRWLWRRMNRAVRWLVLAGVVVAAGAAIVLIPAIRDSRDERTMADAHARAVTRDGLMADIVAAQRPVTGETGAATRVGAAADLRAAIRTDALARVRAGDLDGPIRSVECERFPRTVGDPLPELDTKPRGRYSCLAVTAEFGGPKTQHGWIGHPYRALLDFETGRYAFCKVAPRVDTVAHPSVVIPPECGG